MKKPVNMPRDIDRDDLLPFGHRPILVLGILPRSGTHFLTDLLCLHPDCGPPTPIREDYFLHYADELDRYVDHVAGHWHPNLGISQELRDRLFYYLGSGLVSFLAAQSRAKRTVSMTPRVDCLDRFVKLFPHAHLLIIVRDGRAVLESGIRTFGWNRESAMHRWAQAADQILAFERRYQNSGLKYRIVMYEDLWNDLERKLREILVFLELDPDCYDFEAAKNLPVRGSSTMGQHHGKIHWNPVAKEDNFDPMSRFAHWSRGQHTRFNWVAGWGLEQFGYPLVKTTPSITRKIKNRYLDLWWIVVRTLGTPYLWLRHRLLKPKTKPLAETQTASSRQPRRDMRVAVCVITYMRPVGLRRLLESLNNLTFCDDPPQIEIIVVDNDPQGSARPVCEEARATSKWPIRYEIEPQQGISFARNKTVACALETSDWLAFLDDDQTVTPQWIEVLLRTQQTYGADIVTGPVTPRFVDEVPPWIIKGRFFEFQRHQTGTIMDVAGTNNALVSSDVFRKLGGHFDERNALTGWKDVEFFRRAHRAGHSIVWADHAETQEWTPKSRMRFAWLMKRQFRSGNSNAAVDLKHLPGWKTRSVLVGRAVFWSGVGVVGLLLSLVRGRYMLVRGLRLMAYAAGTLTALFGNRYQEHRITHGS